MEALPTVRAVHTIQRALLPQDRPLQPEPTTVATPALQTAAPQAVAAIIPEAAREAASLMAAVAVEAAVAVVAEVVIEVADVDNHIWNDARRLQQGVIPFCLYVKTQDYHEENFYITLSFCDSFICICAICAFSLQVVAA